MGRGEEEANDTNLPVGATSLFSLVTDLALGWGAKPSTDPRARAPAAAARRHVRREIMLEKLISGTTTYACFADCGLAANKRYPSFNRKESNTKRRVSAQVVPVGYSRKNKDMKSTTPCKQQQGRGRTRRNSKETLLPRIGLGCNACLRQWTGIWKHGVIQY